MKISRFIPIILLFSSCSQQAGSGEVAHANQQRLTLLKHATQGDVEAQFNLGNAYCCGDKGFWSTKEAIHWWCEAAKSKHPGAQRKLAEHKASDQCRGRPSLSTHSDLQ